MVTVYGAIYPSSRIEQSGFWLLLFWCFFLKDLCAEPQKLNRSERQLLVLYVPGLVLWFDSHF